MSNCVSLHSILRNISFSVLQQMFVNLCYIIILDVSGYSVKLTGTKVACNEGGCGSCTVLISKLHHATANIVYAHHFNFPLYLLSLYI